MHIVVLSPAVTRKIPRSSRSRLTNLHNPSYTRSMPNHKGEQTRHNGFAIRDFRIKMNLSSAELAKMAGLSVNGLNNIETETRDTRPVTLYRLARALDVR